MIPDTQRHVTNKRFESNASQNVGEYGEIRQSRGPRIAHFGRNMRKESQATDPPGVTRPSLQSRKSIYLPPTCAVQEDGPCNFMSTSMIISKARRRGDTPLLVLREKGNCQLGTISKATSKATTPHVPPRPMGVTSSSRGMQACSARPPAHPLLVSHVIFAAYGGK